MYIFAVTPDTGASPIELALLVYKNPKSAIVVSFPGYSRKSPSVKRQYASLFPLIPLHGFQLFLSHRLFLPWLSFSRALLDYFISRQKEQRGISKFPNCLISFIYFLKPRFLEPSSVVY